MLRYVNYDIVFQEIPSEVTLALNLSNCPNRCPGCHSPYLQNEVGDFLTEEVLSNLLATYKGGITCICFMGGDVSPCEVQHLAEYLRREAPITLKVGWYSGRPRLPEDLDLQYFDYIKLGPYQQDLGALKSRTTNQRLYRISDQKMIDITSCFWKKTAD